MALNFPASPYTNQEVSANGVVWIWDGIVWNLKSDGSSGGGGSGGTTLQVSDTAPTNPTAGSLWFNSLDGNLYVYYEDDDSSQWIQPASSPFGTGGGGSGSFAGGLVSGSTTFASTTQFQSAITAAAVKNIIPFHYMATSEFPSAAGNQGAIVHSYADGRFYGAHDGVWDPVANLSDLEALPTASTSVLGAVKVDGTTITIANGVISAAGTGTVSSGTAGRLAYYPSNGTTVDDLSSLSWANNTLSVTGRVLASGATNILRSYYADLVTLQGAVSFSTYSGALAYTASENHVYVATGSAWIPLANSSDITNSFYSISVNGQEDIIADTTTQGITFAAGTNITLTSDNTAKRLTISASATQSNSFATIAVAGESNVVADSATDTLTLVAGPNISITTNAGTDTITISATSGGGGSSGVSSGAANRLAYYASTGSVVQDTGANLTWNGSTLGVTGTVTATTFSGSGASLTSIPNAGLVHSSIGVTAGTGIVLSGSSVALGQTLTITNGGVTSLSANTGISLSGATGSIAISNTGVTSITAGTGISISQSTGDITISTSSTGITSVVAGTGAINVTTVNGVATVNNTLTRLNNLSDASNTVWNGSNLTIDKIALPAATMYSVLFRSTLAYTFLSHIPGDNPTLYALAGTTIAFNLQVPGHPFALQTTGGVNLDPTTTTSLGTFFWVGTDGSIAENADAQGKILGTLYWIIGPNAAGTYRYQCTLHPAMRGNIVIKSISALA